MSDGQDLSGAVDMLKNMLGSEDGQQKIQGIISMLGGNTVQDGNESVSSRKDDAGDTENSENTALNNTQQPSISPQDAEMMFKLQKVMSAAKSAENSREAAFLNALAPLLRPERRDKLNSAVKIIGMSRAIKLFKDM